MVRAAGSTEAFIARERAAKDAAKAAAKAKGELEERSRAMGNAVSIAGGPVANLRGKLEALKSIAGKGGAGGALSFLTLGAAAAVAAIAALVVGIGAASVALGRFILKNADAARSARLTREAAMGGNAQWGKQFGEQIDALAKKVPTSRAELDKLGVSLTKQGIYGQTWVDTMGAVSQAAAALGDDAGSKLQEFVTRGRLMQRMQINPREMLGTGLDFGDVAGALAKQMRISVDKARAALFEGRVKLADGAAALKAATEAKFGKLNLRQMLSFENIAKKFSETLEDLTKGVNLEPIVNAFKDVLSVFDLSKVSGQALKQMIELVGDAMGGAATGGGPLLKKVLQEIIIGAQKGVIAFLKFRIWLKHAFDEKTPAKFRWIIDGLKTALMATVVVVGALGVALAGIAAIGVGVAAGFWTLVNALSEIQLKVTKFFIDTDWGSLGRNILDGIVKGIMSGVDAVVEAVGHVTDRIKGVFTSDLEIHSPARAMVRRARFVPKGVAVGVREGLPEVERAAEDMTDALVPSSSGRGARAGAGVGYGAGGAVTVHVSLNVDASGSGDAGERVASPSVLEQITKAILEGLAQAGIPVPA